MGTREASKWRAVELRRRIDNRRQSALAAAQYDANSDDEDEEEFIKLAIRVDSSTSASPISTHSRRRLALGHALPALLDAKHELYGIQSDVFESEAKQVAAIRCADQQFTAEKNMRRLASDLQATQSVVRHKSCRLADLRTRVLHLAHALKDNSEEKTFARTKITVRETIRKEQTNARKCASCDRNFMTAVMEAHETNCVGRKAIALPDILLHPPCSENQATDGTERHGGTSEVGTRATSTLPKFISQPPRNFRVADKGISHNCVQFEWDPPIFTGSHPIVDYELRYAVFNAKRQPGGSEIRQFEAPLPLRISCWCQIRPVPPNRFCLTELSADQQYGEISLAAITKNGKSAPSNRLDLVRTAPPVAPSQPLFVMVGLVTAKSITLSWTPPMDDGGKPIQDYEISFIEAVMEETITFDKNFLDVSAVVYKPRLVRTYSAEPTFMLNDLLSGNEHKDFKIRAVNGAGIPGAFSDPIAALFTIAPGNEFRLLDELQAAVNARTRIIDSQFLSGFMQRYERQNYIELVSRFIISMYPKLERNVQAILERDDVPHLDEDEPPTHQSAARRKRFDELTDEEVVVERRRQFHFRIAEIQKELKRVEYNVQWCKDRQIDLVALIRAAENRILEKQAELERARMFRGPQMDSDVLENGLQRFYTKDLVLALEDEIEIEQLYIVDTKADIVKTENYLRSDEKRLATLIFRLEDRQDALIKCEADPEAFTREEVDAKRTTIARIRDRLVCQTFAALVWHRDVGRESKRKMRAAIQRLITCKLRSAMKLWRQVTRLLARRDASGGDLFGVGSAGLLNASIGRDELASEARAMLETIRQTDTQLQSLMWCDNQQPPPHCDKFGLTKDERYHPFWLEADAKMDVRDFEGAYHVYLSIESNATWTSRMSMRQIIQLQANIGSALFNMGKHDQALVHFHRSYILASRPGNGNKQDEGTALQHVAEVQFAATALRQSVDNYERALLCFEAVGDLKGQLKCHRGLESVFAKLEDNEMTAQHKQLADEIEFALQIRLSEASGRLERLQQQLVGIGAKSSTEIDLERVKANVPRLRRERIKSQYKTREERKWASSLEKLLHEKKAMLAQGEVDLKRALTSDSTQVDSHVINGTNARYEIEDFKRKLAKLMGTVKAAEEHITKEILNSNVRVRNAQDEIKELESELFVETGALMRRMLAKEPIRCFRFNATNEALKNVIGTASHGVSTCVASAGLNGLLFDILSGACLGHALGDPQKDHLGDPIGHQAPIISLFYIGNRIYTGSMDATLGVWDVKDESIGGFSCVLNRLLREFDSAVVSVHADVQWPTTAIFVESFKNTFTTGGADHRIKVWEVGAAASSSSTARRKVKLVHTLEAERRRDEYFNGHLHPVSCMRQVASEVVSGDTSGRLVVWNLDAAERKLLRICDIHKSSVTCLQFDAMKIVSGATDGSICVTDFATGNLVQTLVGHQACVLDLQFDRKRLLSMSVDGKLRLWYWQTRIGIGADRKKYHILGAGETLKSLSLKYRTSIDKLLKWNNLPDSSKMYLGQKLVVEIDTTGAASDELQTLDMKVSTPYGKLAYENLDFLAANKVSSEDVESQWAAQKLAQLAKEYFPPLAEDDDDGGADKKPQDEDKESEVDSDDDSIMAVDSDQDEAKSDEDAGQEGNENEEGEGEGEDQQGQK